MWYIPGYIFVIIAIRFFLFYDYHENGLHNRIFGYLDFSAYFLHVLRFSNILNSVEQIIVLGGEGIVEDSCRIVFNVMYGCV